MNKKVYIYLLGTYGRQLGIWVAFVTEIIRTLITRILLVIILANMTANITAGNIDKVEKYILIFLIASLVAIAIGSAGDLIGLRSENNAYGKLMVGFYKRLTNKDMAFYRDHQTGYLTALFRQHLDSALDFVRRFRIDWVRNFISLTFPVIILYTQSWQIGTLVLLMVVSQIFYMLWASKKVNKYRDMSHEVYRKISGEVSDDLTNIVAYKSSGHEQESLSRIKKLAKQETNIFTLRRSKVVYLDLPRNIVTTALAAFAFWTVINISNSSSETVMLMVLTLTYIFQILRNVSDLPDQIAYHDDLVTKLYPTLDILNSSDERIRDPLEPMPYEPKSASVDIENLDFRYKDSIDRYVFKNLDLHIAAGEHVGIVGLSGAGKSTLASLLMRFDDADSGSIKIDGVDIRNVSQSSLRKSIAYVPQEPVLFHRSVKENIAYDKPASSSKVIEQAAKAAHAHNFIEVLPKGYDTIVGERGIKLSGGQKQRIIIARAILKDSPLILFDEATSALDSESEHIIQQALPEIIGNHTAIIIAHRLSTVAKLDRIIVIHDGEIEEQGTHTELLELKGRYHALWTKQTRQD